VLIATELAKLLPTKFQPERIGTEVVGATGVTLFEALEARLTPALFVAVTVNVYAIPLVSPLTVIGDPVPVVV
jgi:hypothetical protein